MAASNSLNRHQAFAGVLLAACASDGHLADEELDDLITRICRMRMFADWEADPLVELLKDLLVNISDEGVEAVLDRCVKALPQELHKTAFINACDLVMSDGVVEPEEQAYINRLWKALGIPQQEAKVMAQVIVLKNRG